MATLARDLQAAGLELVETHISWVFRGAADVWKIKKPVNLGFLDFSTLPLRRAACEAEVRLNRRLAPAVYLGVVPVTLDTQGHHCLGGAGEPVDWAVHMVRLPDADRGDRRLEEGRLTLVHVERLAEQIAAFHATAETGDAISRFGRPEAILVNVQENFAQTRAVIEQHLRGEEAREIEAYQLGFLERHRDRFEARVLAGRVRDGHGDLRLDQLYLDDSGAATILDCIEFNERFRYADVCADVAFLAMDLAARRRVDLAEGFLAAYARANNDYDLYPLEDFYASYRAYVRGKVATLLAADADASAEARRSAAADARRYFLLALAFKRRFLIHPVLVVAAGVIAAGKTTAARHIAAQLAAPVVSTDWTRKHLVGVESTTPLTEAPWTGAYADATTSRVYTEVLRRAEAVLESGRPVVVDGSFRARAERRAVRQLAERLEVPFYLVECRATPEVCRERLRERARGPSVSDGRSDIFEDFLDRWEPVEELPAAEHLVIDTTRPFAINLEIFRAKIPGWPIGMEG